MMKMSRTGLVFVILLLILFLLFEILPIFWIFSNAIKGEADISTIPPKVFNFKPTFKNFIEGINKSHFPLKILNSFIIAVPSVILSLLIGTMAAYGIVRLKVGGTPMLIFVIITRMLPAIVLILPIFVIFKNLKLNGTYWGLIAVYTTFLLSFVIWQMSSFLKEIPVEIEESAIIDGCNIWQVFFRIILPLSKSGLIAVGIFCFLGAWNEYLFASILGGAQIQTAPVALSYFVLGGLEKKIPWGVMSAGSVIALIPAFILILIVQKQMVEGLTMGAVKG